MVLIVLTSLVILGFIGIHFLLPNAVLKPPVKAKEFTAESLGLDAEPFSLRSHDGLQLSGLWVEGRTDTVKGIMIVMHGFGGNKEEMLPLVSSLANAGVECVLLDGRAHGESEGIYCTYGFEEKRDMSSLADYIKERKPHHPLGIWGHSLGGAIAIQALEADKRLEFGVIESTFTDLEQIIFDYTKNALLGIGLRGLSDYALSRAGRIAEFEPEKVRPIHSVAYIEQPVFMAHGDADANISYKYSQQLFDQLKTNDKELTLIPGGGHLDLREVGGEEYVRQYEAFIKRNLTH